MIAGTVAAAMLSVSLSAWAEEASGEEIGFTSEAEIIPALGETFDVSKILKLSDEEQDILYSSYDDTVAEISEDGVITGTGYGITTIVAALSQDETISASLDVAVFDLYGTYSGEKTIEAMGCDVAIDLTLHEDGTFDYYRAPMEVSLEGGGEMPELKAEGTYELEGAQISFDCEELGGFTAVFGMEDREGYLEGSLPTGGADTEMELVKKEEKVQEESEENGAEPESISEGTEEE